MGNHQSFSAPTSHPRFSKVQFASEALLMLIRQPIFSKQQIVEPWIEKCKLYSHIYSSKDIVKAVDHRIQLSGTCSDSGTLLVTFQDKYITNLKAQIADRQLNGKLYTEQQIWYLLLVISRCASQIYAYGDRHIIGNIHPYNILINRKQEYKIIATNYSFSFPGQLNHFQEYRLHGDSKAFVSPELLGFLSSTKYPGYPEYPQCVEKQSCEAFCLGMTLLSMATLETNLMKCFKAENFTLKRKITMSSKIYNQASALNVCNNGESFLNRKTDPLTNLSKVPVSDSPIQAKNSRLSYSNMINHDYLDSLLSIVKQRYSYTFYEMLVCLIHFDFEKRIRADKLYRQYLSPVEKQISAFDSRWIRTLEAQNQVESTSQGQMHNRHIQFDSTKDNQQYGAISK